MNTYLETVDDYLKHNKHIGGDHPLVFSLRQMAIDLDEKTTIALRREFHSVLRTIEAMKPKEEKPVAKPNPLLTPERD